MRQRPGAAVRALGAPARRALCSCMSLLVAAGQPAQPAPATPPAGPPATPPPTETAADAGGDEEAAAAVPARRKLLTPRLMPVDASPGLRMTLGGLRHHLQTDHEARAADEAAQLRALRQVPSTQQEDCPRMNKEWRFGGSWPNRTCETVRTHLRCRGRAAHACGACVVQWRLAQQARGRCHRCCC
jgi:pyruvate/2-oxoglutarate dehydrogenase complex dihydrolipoamide acyltransferase (E2) component